MNLRRLVELACRQKSYWRRLPTEFGNRPILVSPDAALRWLRPSAKAFDEHLMDIARGVEPGDVVWDIGANVGLFALMAAHRSGASVYAAEADGWLAGLVRRSAEANGDRDITVASVAIGARSGIGEFAIAERGRAASGLVEGALSTQTGGAREIRPVRIETLDGLLKYWAEPAIVKIDIEGSELGALRGADRLLRDIRPRLIIEIANSNFDLAEALLANYRYSLRRVDGDNFEAVHMGEPGGARNECQTVASSQIVRLPSIGAYAAL